ncbi:hypothetical protein H4J58_01765 [Colwellia sp. MB3u-70]|uniref:hypothetical protein n=1 Tax=unclassified Colwellia TaxID=196834 RepID=UPI0015F3A974|nr:MULTISPECIES: hypothetical protein [unclassified Colwellia]MBA6291426.1 hypothetical protein [Colwellia sp. MB3u-8]MBA6305863.1 hypothetical protein [Colwellia sp. MB3u-70]
MISHKNIQNVCYLKSSSNNQAYYDIQRHIFWPFHLWRVTAPKEKAPLNIFQMLLLKLVKAGCTANDKLCLYSNLDKELVKYILAQLTSNGFLDSWTITDKAVSLLEGKQIKNQEISSYYLIQDATTGKLMPRVLSSLPHIEKMDFSAKFPAFVVSKGSGKTVSPLMVNNIQRAVQPTAEQMNVCLREHRRVLNQLKQADLYVADADSEVNYSIDFIEQEPIAAFMHTRLFSTITGERSWYLSDPAGLTETLPELNEVAEKIIESNKNFASRVNDVMGIAEKEHMTSYQEQMLQFEKQAKVELLSKYPWVQKYSLIDKHLLGMLRLKKQVEFESNPRFELLDGLLSELQRVLEAWLKEAIEPKKTNIEWEVFVVEWDGSWPKFQIDKRIREQVFYRVNGVSKDVSYQLSTVQPSAIRSALTYGNQSLKPLVAGMLLKNPEMVEVINSQYPTWLDLIIPLANDRNKFASHAGGKSISKENVMEHLSSVDELLIVLEEFLGSK